ncbi:MAG TPA: glycosyltransferase, partial [Candidatus Lambdaproteobacteria bacterium]|nr:glycosyltransferase [Candidatus Lambdaproteobacteria bacterium]
MSSEVDPVVSVIVTTKNEDRNIGACLESVVQQSMPPLEMIVVDNYSEDKTAEIAQEYGAKVFQLGPERSAQRNYGVEQAQGKYILYLDADMRLSQKVIEECVNCCEADNGVTGIYIPEIIVGEGFWIKVRRFERSFYDGTVIDAVRFVPRATFQKVGGFDIHFTGPEDWDFDKKIRGLGKTVIVDAYLEHDEGDFNLQHYLNKKNYYSKGFEIYTEKWGKDDPDIRKQLSPWYRFVGVFVEHGKFIKLMEHPILSLGMYYLRFRVGLLYLTRKN